MPSLKCVVMQCFFPSTMTFGDFSINLTAVQLLLLTVQNVCFCLSARCSDNQISLAVGKAEGYRLDSQSERK